MPRAVPVPEVRQVTGVVVDDGGTLRVNVNGAVLGLPWPAGYIPTAGDLVTVDIVNGRGRVTGPKIVAPRAETGTAGAESAGLVPVTTSGGVVLARYMGSAPTPGAVVRLDWQATQAWVLPGEVAALGDVPTPGGATPPPPPPSTGVGTLPVPAVDSGTRSSAGVWDSYYGTNVTQGSWGGRTYTGAWFYGAKPAQLRGRTVTRFAIRLGARVRQGAYNSPLTLNLYRHTSNSRPAGDVSRVAGPHAVVLAVNAPAQWVVLPTAWGQAIVDSGGGIGIAGGSYGGVLGIGDDGASGQLAFDWQR